MESTTVFGTAAACADVPRFLATVEEVRRLSLDHRRGPRDVDDGVHAVEPITNGAWIGEVNDAVDSAQGDHPHPGAEAIRTTCEPISPVAPAMASRVMLLPSPRC